MARASPPSAFGNRYAGTVAVVTGASSGLGAQLCRDLARAGATVVGLARSEEPLALLSTELEADSPKSGTIVCDVADTDALRAALDRVTAAHGRRALQHRVPCSVLRADQVPYGRVSTSMLWPEGSSK